MARRRLLMVLTRLSWAALALVGPPAWSSVLEPGADWVRLGVGGAAWLAWGVTLAALVALSTVSLTVVRLIVTMAVPVQVVIAVADPSAWSLAAVIAGTLTAIGVLSAEFAHSAVGASAYGAEERFPLKPPAPFLAPMMLAWLVLTAMWITAAVSLLRGSLVLGGVVTAVAIAASAILGLRFHRMTRRWLVLVPVGLVVHDPLLLSETLLVRRQELAGIGLAVGDPTSLNLTGITGGVALQLDFREPQVVIPRSPGRDPSSVKPVRATSVVVAPSRPGLLLSAARQARLT